MDCAWNLSETCGVPGPETSRDISRASWAAWAEESDGPLKEGWSVPNRVSLDNWATCSRGSKASLGLSDVGLSLSFLSSDNTKLPWCCLAPRQPANACMSRNYEGKLLFEAGRLTTKVCIFICSIPKTLPLSQRLVPLMAWICICSQGWLPPAKPVSEIMMDQMETVPIQPTNRFSKGIL